ncbi:MAG TPA: hypothetical protein VND42_01330 [Candidatus Acidoferrales bacterium]|nr:hypothetical protein [Candidatus Acidoferrales bacterium]
MAKIPGGKESPVKFGDFRETLEDERDDAFRPFLIRGIFVREMRYQKRFFLFHFDPKAHEHENDSHNLRERTGKD